MPQGKVFDLGRQGDGLLKDGKRTLFISGALPGETVDYETDGSNRARLLGVLTPASDRAEPVCPFFGRCGGCTLQHLKPDAYRRFKMRYLKELFPADWELPEFDDPVFVDFINVDCFNQRGNWRIIPDTRNIETNRFFGKRDSTTRPAITGVGCD